MSGRNSTWNRYVSVLLIVCMVAALLMPAIRVNATDTDAVLWVDPVNGNDANDGTTESNAFKTISYAKTKASALSETSDVTVYLKGGTYNEGTITFGEAESGKNGHTITYKSAAGETAIISGGTRLTGWSLHNTAENIYVADIPEGTALTRQFYVDGEPMPNAYTEMSPTDWLLFNSNSYMSPYVQSPDNNEYLILDLGEAKPVSSVVLYAGAEADANGLAAGFPKDFTISTSLNGEDWQTQVTETDFETPSVLGRIECVFTSVSARYVKINVTELGTAELLNPNKYSLSLSEVAVGLANEGGEINLDIVEHLNKKVNLISADKVQIGYYKYGDTLTGWTDYVHGSCPAANLIDGDKSTIASTNAQLAEWLYPTGNHVQAYVFDIRSNGYAVSVGAISLAVRGSLLGAPIDFDIQLSNDGSSWRTVTSAKNYDWEAVEYENIFTFNPESACYLRILAYQTNPDGSNYYLQFAEAAIYKPADVALGATIEAPNNDEPDSMWGKDYLANGLFDGRYTSGAGATATGVNAPVTVVMDKVQNIAGVRLYPRYAGTEAIQYPTAVRISVSEDGETFERVLELYDIKQPTGGAQLFVFPEAVNARYVRVEPLQILPGSTETTYRFQLHEIEVAPAAVVIPDSANKIEIPADTIKAGYYEKGVATSTLAGLYGTGAAQLSDYPYSNLVDGNKATVASSPNDLDMKWIRGQLYDKYFLPSVRVELGGSYFVNSVALTCTDNTAFAPYDFMIQVSGDGTNWTTVKTVEAYQWTGGETATFTFDPVAVSYVQIIATMIIPELNGTVYSDPTTAPDNAKVYLRLAELEVYKTDETSSDTEETSVAEIEISADTIKAGYYEKGVATSTLAGLYGTGAAQLSDYPYSNLVDGNKATVASSPNDLDMKWIRGQLYDKYFLPSVRVELGGSYFVNSVALTCTDNTAFAPYDFMIQVSGDGTNWTTVKTVEAYQWTGGETATFTFDPVAVSYVQIIATMIIPELNGTVYSDPTTAPDNAKVYLRLAELEVYSTSFSNKLVTQGDASVAGSAYDIFDVTAKNDNADISYNANRVIDGNISPIDNYGWSVPESYNMESFGNVTDVEIHFLALWYHRIYHITGVSADGTEVYATTNGLRPTWLANAYEFIDSTGEWYIDRTAGKIYYKAESTMDGVEAILPTVEQVISMKDASNITFDGIIFEHTSYTLPSEVDYIDHQANAFAHDGWTQVNGGIMMDSCEAITITNSVIRNMGTAGIKVRSTDSISNNIQITNNVIHDISYNGITIGEVYKHHGYESWQLVTNTTIQNNYITRVGLDVFDSPAIVATYTNGTVIDHNEIAYCPYTGISTGWGWDEDNDTAAAEVGNNQITNNLIHDTGKTNRDGGSIYNLGSSKGTIISGNYLYNSWDGAKTFEQGIYLDQGSAYIEIYNNVIGGNVNDWLNEWKYTIHDNYWHDNYYHEDLTMRADGTNTTIENNTAVEDGDFSQYPAAMAVINNAGLLTADLKEGVAAGFAPEHDIVQEIYDGLNSRYIENDWGWNNVAIAGQASTTLYNSANHNITIYMPAGTDKTSLSLTFDLEEGFTSDKASGSVQDFTNPVTYTLTNGTETVEWTVTVKVQAAAGGEITGTVVTLDAFIADSGNWTKTPSATTEDGLTFNTYSGYIGQRIATDAILKFDMTAELYADAKDWLQISLRNQDPYTMCINGNTEYIIGFNHGDVEVQKFVKGERTVLYGNIDGFTSAFGVIPNHFFTAGVRHSITVGAIDVDDGVRLFLFVDGNLVFDIIDADEPITDSGFFAVYGMTHPITVSQFTDIEYSASVEAYSVTLEDSIGVDFYMDLSDEIVNDEAAYVEFTLPNKNQTKVKVDISEDMKTVTDYGTLYKVTCNVAAKEMTGTIYAQVVTQSGSWTSEVFEYDVQTYAEKILADPSAYEKNADKQDELVTLVKAMLNYGTAAQTHFGFNTDKPANSILASADQAVTALTVDDLTDYNFTAGTGIEGVADYVGATLMLEANTGLRLYFKVAEGANVTFRLGDKSLTYVPKAGSNYTGYVEISGIVAKDLDETYTVTVSDGTNTAEITHSPLKYCRNVVKGDYAADLDNLVAALYAYNQAANAYFN